MHNVTKEAEPEAVLAARARQNVVLCLLGIIFNLTLLIVVCLSQRLRCSIKYQLIASLSLADVLITLIYLPLDTSMAFHGGEWTHGCGLLFFTYGIQEFVMPTIASLTLSALCVEYSVTMFYNVTLSLKRRLVLLGVFLPWIAGFLALIPIYTQRFVASSGSFTTYCADTHRDMATLIILIGIFGYLPIAFLTGCLILMLISHCCRPPDERIAMRMIASQSEGVYLTHEIADTIIACLISIAFNLPFLIEFATHVYCEGWSCRGPTRMQHALEVLRTAESVFFPAVWMLGMEFRHGLFTSCKCCYTVCNMDGTGSAV